MNLRTTATAFLSFASTVTGVRVLSEHCSTIKADFARRQLNEWNSTEAFTIGSIRCPDGVGNVPVLTVSEDGSSFQIDVPIGSQVATDDPDTVHFVTHTYAEDQVRLLVALFGEMILHGENFIFLIASFFFT